MVDTRWRMGTVEIVNTDDLYADEHLTDEQREALEQVRASVARDLSATDSGWRGHVSKRQLGVLVAVGVFILLLAVVPAVLLRSNGVNQEQTLGHQYMESFILFKRGAAPENAQVRFVEKHAVVSESSTSTTYALRAGGECLGVTISGGAVGDVAMLTNSWCKKH